MKSYKLTGIAVLIQIIMFCFAIYWIYQVSCISSVENNVDIGIIFLNKIELLKGYEITFFLLLIPYILRTDFFYNKSYGIIYIRSGRNKIYRDLISEIIKSNILFLIVNIVIIIGFARYVMEDKYFVHIFQVIFPIMLTIILTSFIAQYIYFIVYNKTENKGLSLLIILFLLLMYNFIRGHIIYPDTEYMLVQYIKIISFTFLALLLHIIFKHTMLNKEYYC